MNFYLADTHYGHANILKYSKRPFSSVEEMNEAMITNHNAVVSDNDDVYFDGDFSYKGGDPVQYLKRLKGRKHLIIGSHDSGILSSPEARKYFVEIEQMIKVNDNGTKIVLFHCPIVEWEGYYNGVLHFYGHVHNNFQNPTTRYAYEMPNAYNIGVDIIGFTPKTLGQILEIYAHRKDY